MDEVLQARSQSADHRDATAPPGPGDLLADLEAIEETRDERAATALQRRAAGAGELAVELRAQLVLADIRDVRVEALMSEADRRLHAAKRGGRDRVVSTAPSVGMA
jgi:hypothetical protein